MSFSSALAIYVLFWTLTLFTMLPIGVKTHREAGEEPGKGHADSAPVRPNLWRKAMWTTVVATIIFAIFYANYEFGWVTLDNFMRVEPPRFRY